MAIISFQPVAERFTDQAGIFAEEANEREATLSQASVPSTSGHCAPDVWATHGVNSLAGRILVQLQFKSGRSMGLSGLILTSSHGRLFNEDFLRRVYSSRSVGALIMHT